MSFDLNNLTIKKAAKLLQEKQLSAVELTKIHLERIKQKEICMVINTPTIGKDPKRAGFQIRSMAENYKIPCFTSLDTANAYLIAMKTLNKNEKLTYETINFYMKSDLKVGIKL